MRWLAPLVVVAACGSEPGPQPKPEPVVIPEKPLPPFTGTHGEPIATLAITFDGRAAASADRAGGLRLWPTLDGAREPIVIGAAAPAALALTHAPDGFGLAVTDSADQVELIRIDTRGAVRARHRLGEVTQIEAVADGFLVLRADQVIELVAIDGTSRGRLPAEPGTRVQLLVVQGALAKAVVADDRVTRVIAIDLETMRWSSASPALALAHHAPVILSPDGKFAIGTAAKSQRIARFDLATGKAVHVCAESLHGGFSRHFDGEFFREAGLLESQPMAVVGTKLACFVDGTFSWWNLDDGSHTTASLGDRNATAFAAASDRVVFGSEHQLVIQLVDKTQFLGYGFRELVHVRSVPTGVMIGKGDRQPLLLDESFKERARFALPNQPVGWADLLPIDDRFVLTSSTRPNTGDVWGSAYQIGVYDLVKQAMHHVLPYRARGGDLVYEPATRILVASEGTTTLLLRFDPKTQTLGDEVRLDIPEPPRQVALLDPALSGGVLALAIEHARGEGVQVHEISARDWPSKPERDGQPRTIMPRRSYRITGEVRAVDRAGRIYVHDAANPETIEIDRAGSRHAVLPGVRNAKLRPSPDGRHVIAIEDAELTLFTTDGRRTWSVAAWGASDVDWTPTGVLYARFPTALARIDLVTGKLAERQCGWGFGISDTPRDSASSAPSVCDVAP